jgi:hypothetical protein
MEKMFNPNPPACQSDSQRLHRAEDSSNVRKITRRKEVKAWRDYREETS